MPGKSEKHSVGRRSLLGAAAAALSAGAMRSPAAFAQTKAETSKGEHNHSASNPGPVNKALANANPNSDQPPITDRGVIVPIWYSFDLTHRRIQDGGWTRLWFFPAGYPHSIQGLGPDGCEFLLVFDEGMFSEYNTFLISGWLAHTPAQVLSRNLNIPEAQLASLPEQGLYIFPGTVPGPLEDDRRAVAGSAVASKIDYTFRMKAMKPTAERPGGSARIVDSNTFHAAKTIASALFTVKPSALRELHWHPNASEWQYYISGSGRMTVFTSAGDARTMDYRANDENDVGFVPQVAGHYVENMGNDDLVFLALFKSSYFSEVSLNQWIRRLPVQMTQQHLHLDATAIARIPETNNNIFAR